MGSAQASELHSRPGGRGGGRDAQVHVGIVAAPDGILVTLVARRPKDLWQCLARYAQENACHKLWPEDALAVTELVKAGRARTAVECYFEHVGERWDAESLHVEVVELA